MIFKRVAVKFPLNCQLIESPAAPFLPCGELHWLDVTHVEVQIPVTGSLTCFPLATRLLSTVGELCFLSCATCVCHLLNQLFNTLHYIQFSGLSRRSKRSCFSEERVTDRKERTQNERQEVDRRSYNTVSMSVTHSISTEAGLSLPKLFSQSACQSVILCPSTKKKKKTTPHPMQPMGKQK